MNSNIQKQRNNESIDTSVSYNNNSFNFELWAKEVRPHLVAALQRRAAKN